MTFDRNKLKNYSKLNLDEIKKISLDVLIDIDDFCCRNRITYFLACGTLLGAIRHKGFIPWDNDIDIMMPRPDYERFFKEYNGKYKLCSPSSGMYFYGKVYDDSTLCIEKDMDYKKYNPIGVYVDVFPLDGVINDKKKLDKLTGLSFQLERLLRLSNQPIFYRKNKLKAINRIIPRIIGSKNLARMIEKNAKKYGYDNCDYVMRVRWSLNGSTGALPKKIYEVTRAEFEGYMFNIPIGYDRWLKNFFGDYMILPPENKRKSHENECYKIIN